MAIQVRRGNYADLDISKLIQGEPFVTLDTAPDGAHYVGMAIGPNDVVRLATFDDLTDIRTDCIDARDDAVAAAGDAAASESICTDAAEDSEAWAVGERNGTPVTSGDDTYHNNSKYYAELSGQIWDNVQGAVDQVVPVITMNFIDGKLYYTGQSLGFFLDETTGNLCWEVIV